MKKIITAITFITLALIFLISLSCEKSRHGQDSSSDVISQKNIETSESEPATAVPDTTTNDNTQEPAEPVNNVKVYVDMDFDNVNDGADVPDVVQEGAGFKVIKDDKGNGWAVAKSTNEWASCVFDAYGDNGEKINIKDFCLEAKVYLPFQNQGQIKDGGVSICVSENDRYDISLYWGNNSSGINVYQASDTAKGAVATNLDVDKGYVSYFKLDRGQKYLFTVIGKYRKDDENNEFVRLYMYIDNQFVLNYELPYWSGGFAVRAWQSDIRYDYVKISDIPSILPDGMPAEPTDVANSNIYVDFSTREGLPLFKRQSYCVEQTTAFEKNAHHLIELRSRTARFMLKNGAVSESEIDVISFMRKAMSDSGSFGKILRSYSAPCWYLRWANAAIDPKVKETDPANAVWYEPVYSIWNPIWSFSAEFMANKSMRSLYEIWNEPDQTYWTRFDWDGYLRMYQNTATALRDGDKNAFVGGPAISSLDVLGEDNFIKFLEMLSVNSIPLDFFSLHSYKTGAQLTNELDRVREGLLLYGDFRSTQIFFSEYNVYTPVMSEWTVPFEERTDFKLQSSSVVPAALSEIIDFNCYTDVTQIQWAWLLLENGSFALVDNNGNRSPLYHALYAYAHMPTDAVKTENTSKTVQIVASSDSVSAAALLWNKSATEEKTKVVLNNIPFQRYDVTVYRIDKTHSSYFETKKGDEFETVETIKGCTAPSYVWNDSIPGLGTVYITITTDGLPELERHSTVGNIIRCDNFFENRLQNSYSDYDDLTSTAIVGTGNNETARGLVAVTYNKVNKTIKVSGSLPYNGIKRLSDHSCLEVRVDYHTKNGYSKSVSYSVMEPTSFNGREYPFGTCRKPDEVINVSISGFEMDIKGRAPDDWDGQIIISFDIEDTGKWTEAKFSMN